MRYNCNQMSRFSSQVVGFTGLLSGVSGLIYGKEASGLGILVIMASLLFLRDMKYSRLILGLGQVLLFPALLVASLKQGSVAQGFASSLLCLPGMFFLRDELAHAIQQNTLKRPLTNLLATSFFALAALPLLNQMERSPSPPSAIAMATKDVAPSLNPSRVDEKLKVQRFSKTVAPSRGNELQVYVNYPGAPYLNRQLASADRAEFAKTDLLVTKTFDHLSFVVSGD